jgi:hypothetical protein
MDLARISDATEEQACPVRYMLNRVNKRLIDLHFNRVWSFDPSNRLIYTCSTSFEIKNGLGNLHFPILAATFQVEYKLSLAGSVAQSVEQPRKVSGLVPD